MPTRRLGIHFGDNDFFYACTSFLRTLLPDDKFTHHMARDLTFTKAQVVELFNRMVPALYLLKQNAWRYKPTPAEYFEITESEVYLDDEVDKFMAEHRTCSNGEFFAMDFPSAYAWSF